MRYVVAWAIIAAILLLAICAYDGPPRIDADGGERICEPHKRRVTIRPGDGYVHRVKFDDQAHCL